jgi:hypothetical protein
MYILAPNRNTCSSIQAPDSHLSANNYRNSTEEEEETLYNLYKWNPAGMYMPDIGSAVSQWADIGKENSFFYYYV